MSGLFVNFYEVDIKKKVIPIATLEYHTYSSKESFKSLKASYPNIYFYRDNDKILVLYKTEWVIG